jgi:Fe-S cluster assembly iron-binding protein IscA
LLNERVRHGVVCVRGVRKLRTAMRKRVQRRTCFVLAVCSVVWGACACWAQDLYPQEQPVPLGDLARSLRKEHKSAVVPTVIDNDNLSVVMDQVATRRLAGTSLVFSFDQIGKTFQVSTPDVTCSLSFSANATSLISDPYVSRELPESELTKLDGPAAIDGDNLQVAVYNGTTWRVDEITVGLTIVKKGLQTARRADTGLLVPASQTTVLQQATTTAVEKARPDSVEAATSKSVEQTTTKTSEQAIISGAEQKRPDVTTLYKIRAAAAPLATTVFRTGLTVSVGPDEEWHWAIVQAKGIPPRSGTNAQGTH